MGGAGIGAPIWGHASIVSYFVERAHSGCFHLQLRLQNLGCYLKCVDVIGHVMIGVNLMSNEPPRKILKQSSGTTEWKFGY